MVTDNLEAVLSPTVSGLGYELWGIEQQRLPRGLLVRLYIDGPEGITLADCEKVSRQVRDVLEVEQALRDDYLLEVSSPGLDRALFKLDHYRRFCGAQVQVRLRIPQQGRRRLQGILREVEEQSIAVECEGERMVLPFNAIERTRVVPEWPDKNPSPQRASGRQKRTG